MRSTNYLNRFLSLLMPIVIILLFNKFLITKDYSFEKSSLQFLILSSVLSLFTGYVFSFFYSITLVFLLIFSFHSTIFNSLPSKEVIFTILDSNSSESLSFIYSYLNFSIISILLVCVAGIFFHKKLQFFKAPHKVKIFVPVIFLLISPIVFNKKNNLKSTFGFIYHVQDYQSEITKLNLLIQNPKVITTKPFENHATPEKVFIVIGESLSKHHMSLYGYNRNTNPLLSKEKLVLFKNAISPNAFTNESIKKILSFSSHQNPDGIFEMGDIIDISRSARFETVWISNQSVFGSNDSSSAYFAKKSDKRYYTFKQYGHDEQVISLINKAIKPNVRQVFFIHLIGSHFIYSDRYPIEFTHFKNSPNKDTDSYDNSVLYNDYVVSDILKTVKALRKSAFVYLADHGEEVYEFRKFRGHAEEIASHFMFDVPYLFWFSSELQVRKPNLNKKVQTQDFIHTFQYILNAKSRFYMPTRDIFSESFIEDEKIPMGKISYTTDLSRFNNNIITNIRTFKKVDGDITVNSCKDSNSICIFNMSATKCEELISEANSNIDKNKSIIMHVDHKCLDQLTRIGFVTSWIIPSYDISTTRKKANFNLFLSNILSKYSISYLACENSYCAYLREFIPTKPLMTNNFKTNTIDPMIHFTFKKDE